MYSSLLYARIPLEQKRLFRSLSTPSLFYPTYEPEAKVGGHFRRVRCVPGQVEEVVLVAEHVSIPLSLCPRFSITFARELE